MAIQRKGKKSDQSIVVHSNNGTNMILGLSWVVVERHNQRYFSAGGLKKKLDLLPGSHAIDLSYDLNMPVLVPTKYFM